MRRPTFLAPRVTATPADQSVSTGRGHRRVLTSARVGVALAVLVAMLAAAVAPAWADSVQNNVEVGGNDTITLTGASGSTSVSYQIKANSSGSLQGCDAADGSPVAVTVNVPPGVTKSTSVPLSFSACDAPQSVTLSSSLVGEYGITVSVSDTRGNYSTSGATFTLKVRRTNSAPTVTVGGVTNGASYEKGSVPVAACNVTDAEDGARTFAATLSAVTGSLSGYGLGSQTASCSYTDAAGATATASATYSIVDSTAPVLTLPGDIFRDATGGSGAQVTYSATATDAVDPAPVVSCSPASGSVFILGATLVSCTAGDAAGNSSSGQFNVTVQDSTPPSLTLPADITKEATGPSGASVAYVPAPSASDTVDGPLTPSCSPDSGSTFALGITPVNCSVSDNAKNSASGGFNVNVVDTTAPVLALPADQLLEATGPGGVVLTYKATASDLVNGTVAVVCDQPSGTEFELGSSTVSCSAEDARGNRAGGSFKVAVRDTRAPTLTLPGNITEEATKAAGRDITFFPTASDLVDGDVPVICSPTSGGTFSVGETTVSCSATDEAKNSSSGTFKVTITDTTPPTINGVPGNAIVEATGPGGASYSYTAPTATDIVDGVRPVSCLPASGSTFPLGVTTVTCTASDTRGNQDTATFTVDVVDTTPPTIENIPANFDLDATGSDGAPATWAPVTAKDIVDGVRPVSCAPASGSTFPLGVTEVTCTASDTRPTPNTSTAAFTVSVSDKSAPNVTVPRSQEIEATGPAGAVATWSGVSAFDLVDGKIAQVPCTPSSGSMFGLGETPVTCTAKDKVGNVGSNGFTIKVVDTTPPEVTVPVNFNVEATGPDGAAVTFSATAKDIVDGSVTPTCSVSSGAVLPLGAHTVTCSAVDNAKNPSAAKSFIVTVRDTTGPALTVPDNQTLEAASAEGTVLSYSVTAVDLVDGPVNYECLPASGSTFPIAITTVNCTALDQLSNKSTKTFTVTVKDTTAPTLNVPADITVFATAAAGALVTYQATATDTVDTGVNASCSPASGTTFTPGTTKVTCSAKDIHDNAAASKSFNVKVVFDFAGFFAPVDTNKVLNGMKAGSTVPMKWRISNQTGGYISDLGIVKAGSPSWVAVPCTAGAVVDDVTEYTAGASSLKYDTTGNQFVYNWQSPKKVGACYQVTVTFIDGTSQSALFRLR